MAYVYNIGIATVGPLAGFSSPLVENVAAGFSPPDIYGGLPPLQLGGLRRKAAATITDDRVEGAFNMPGIFRRSNGGMVTGESLAVINRAKAQNWQLSYGTRPARTEFRLKFPS